MTKHTPMTQQTMSIMFGSFLYWVIWNLFGNLGFDYCFSAILNMLKLAVGFCLKNATLRTQIQDHIFHSGRCCLFRGIFSARIVR